MPAETPPTMRAGARKPSDGAYAAAMDAGIDSETPRTSIILRPYRSPSAEVQHRGGEAERVADGDEVQRGLRRVERDADVGQRDVGDRQVQAGDCCDQDEREEDERAVLRRSGSLNGTCRPAGRFGPSHLLVQQAEPAPVRRPRRASSRPAFDKRRSPGSSPCCVKRSARRRSPRSSRGREVAEHSHLGGRQRRGGQSDRDGGCVGHPFDLAEPLGEHPESGYLATMRWASRTSICDVLTSPSSSVGAPERVRRRR